MTGSGAPHVTPTRLLTLLEPKIQAALDGLEPLSGAGILWDASIVPAGPSGNPSLALCLFMPGAVMGTQVHTVGIYPYPMLVSDADLAQGLSSLVEALLGERSKQLSANGNVLKNP